MEIGSATSAQTRDEFLQLLVAQLRNQDPLEPVKQEDFLAQLAQFSTLEGIEKLNDNFETQLETQQDSMWMDQMAQATSLIGQNVTFLNENHARVSGVVDSVQISADGFGVVVGDDTVSVSDIVQIGETAATTEPAEAPEGEAADPGTSDEDSIPRLSSSFEAAPDVP